MGKPVLDRVPSPEVILYTVYKLLIIYLISTLRLLTLLSPPFVIIRAGGVEDAEEGGDSDG